MAEAIVHGRRFQDLTGRRYGRLTVLSWSHTTRRRAFWQCRCNCGKMTVVPGGHLKNGHTKSCGCLKRERDARRYRVRPEYSSWHNMNQRCYNKNLEGYQDYGAKGVAVCDRWRGRGGFMNFLDDMGRRPSPQHSLDRYPDVTGHYCPENCRWATLAEQARNRRVTRLVAFAGKTMVLKDWATELGIPYTTLRNRLNRGMSPEQAFKRR